MTVERLLLKESIHGPGKKSTRLPRICLCEAMPEHADFCVVIPTVKVIRKGRIYESSLKNVYA